MSGLATLDCNSVGKETPISTLRNQGVDDFAWAEAVKAFVAWLLSTLATKIPFLGWPIVGWIISYFVTPILIEFIAKLKDWFQFNLIDHVVWEQIDAYEKAKEEFQRLHDDLNATDEQLQKAKDKFENDFRSLIDLK